MAKESNKYVSLLNKISVSKTTHKEEFEQIRNDYFSFGLEEQISRFSASFKPLKSLLDNQLNKEQKTIKFTLLYYQNKLDIYNKFEKNYKAFLTISKEYEALLERCVTNYNTVLQIQNQTKGNDLSNINLKNIIIDKPKGFDSCERKYIKIEESLTKLFEQYFSMNQKNFNEDLQSYLTKSMENSSSSSNNIEINLDRISNEQNAENGLDLLDKEIENYEIIKSIILESESVTDEQLNEIKHYLALVLNANQLEFFSKFESEIINDYKTSEDSKNKIKNSLNTSVDNFMSGVNLTLDTYTEIKNKSKRYKAIENLIHEKILSISLSDFIANPDKLYNAIGLLASLNKMFDEIDSKSHFLIFNKGLSKIKDKIKSLINEANNYLVNDIGIDSTLTNKNILGNFSTVDKKREIGIALTTNYANIKSRESIIKVEDIELNKQLGLYIVKVIESARKKEDVFSCVDEYHEGKLQRLLILEEKENNIFKPIPKQNKEEINRLNARIEYDKDASRDAIMGAIK